MVETKVIYCSSCGTTNVSGARFCTNCGAQIQANETSASAIPTLTLVTLTCPNCGGKLGIMPDMERFTCQFCGTEHLVQRSAGAVSLSPVVEGLKRVENKFDQVLGGSDRLAAEQTIQRLKVEIPELERQVAVKEAQINAIIPRESLHRVANGMTQIGSVALAFLLMIFIFTWAGLFNDSPRIEHYLQLITTNWLPILLSGLACLFLGSMLTRVSRAKRSVRVNPKRPNAYEKRMMEGNTEVARLKAELETRKQQLDQLHQYTAERNN